jgi:hypothetical protein
VYFNGLNEDDIGLNVVDEMIILNMYRQLTNPAFVDRRLDWFLQNDIDYLSILLPADPNRIITKLKSIFNLKKGKVIPFIRK